MHLRFSAGIKPMTGVIYYKNLTLGSSSARDGGLKTAFLYSSIAAVFPLLNYNIGVHKLLSLILSIT
jgi:hypothetical protein